MVHLMGQLNYAEVLDAVREKFPGVGPFLIKYQDRCSSRKVSHNPAPRPSYQLSGRMGCLRLKHGMPGTSIDIASETIVCSCAAV